jgi:hypothetical protein
MAQPFTTPQQMSPSVQPPRRIAQGTAVFFETISAGISACF